MANKPRLTVALPFLKKEIERLGPKVVDNRILTTIFEANKDKWRLPLAMTPEKFVDELTEQDFMKHEIFMFPGLSPKLLFFDDNASVYEISGTIFPHSYLSHYSAVTLWGLTEQIPKTIYITQEQSQAPSKSQPVTLTQSGIDGAFQKPQRQSETFALFNDFKIMLLRGKGTKNLGVQTTERENSALRITDVERTLIDIAVRPSYAGGVSEVLKAFRLANDYHNISVNKLSGYLNRMSFIYPYHQAIGFYLSHAGNYKPSQLAIFKNKPKPFDFYLTYEMTDPDYDEEWQIYYPKGLV